MKALGLIALLAACGGDERFTGSASWSSKPEFPSSLFVAAWTTRTGDTWTVHTFDYDEALSCDKALSFPPGGSLHITMSSAAGEATGSVPIVAANALVPSERGAELRLRFQAVSGSIDVTNVDGSIDATFSATFMATSGPVTITGSFDAPICE